MNSLLVTYLLNQGIILKQSKPFISNEDIQNLYKKLEPIINGISYGKGHFKDKAILNLNHKSPITTFWFDNKDTYPICLIKDIILDDPELKEMYLIMYYTNENNQIILLNYELY